MALANRQIHRAIFSGVDERLKKVGRPIQWLNEDFTRPKDAFIAVNWFPAETRRQFIGSSERSYYSGLIQINAYRKAGIGTNGVVELAQEIIDAFPPDTQLSVDKKGVQVLRIPSLGPILQDINHVMAPVTIRYGGLN